MKKARTDITIIPKATHLVCFAMVFPVLASSHALASLGWIA